MVNVEFAKVPHPNKPCEPIDAHLRRSVVWLRCAAHVSFDSTCLFLDVFAGGRLSGDGVHAIDRR